VVAWAVLTEANASRICGKQTQRPRAVSRHHTPPPLPLHARRTTTIRTASNHHSTRPLCRSRICGRSISKLSSSATTTPGYRTLLLNTRRHDLHCTLQTAYLRRLSAADVNAGWRLDARHGAAYVRISAFLCSATHRAATPAARRSTATCCPSRSIRDTRRTMPCRLPARHYLLTSFRCWPITFVSTGWWPFCFPDTYRRRRWVRNVKRRTDKTPAVTRQSGAEFFCASAPSAPFCTLPLIQMTSRGYGVPAMDAKPLLRASLSTIFSPFQNINARVLHGLHTTTPTPRAPPHLRHTTSPLIPARLRRLLRWGSGLATTRHGGR